MERLSVLAQLPAVLLDWYDANHRELPWRQDREPYHVWLSEIMLQQTRVEAVKGYYSRFLSQLPTVQALAECSDDVLSKLWEGLGYYSRMRNLKKAANILVSQYGGAFPRTYDEIRALPGVGDYTAGAVCSIAFDLPTPAVDGNVLRVVTRLTEDDTPIDLPAFKTAVREDLAKIYPIRAGDFTQALMELGATLCGPNRPAECALCPCRSFCAAGIHGTPAKYPVKLPRRQRREEERTVFILRCGDRFALTRRPDMGLLAGLWQFPDTAGTMKIPEAVEYLSNQGVNVRQILRQVDRKHIFTHILWKMRGIYLEVSEEAPVFVWYTLSQIDGEAALPTAYRQFREEL